MKHAKHLVACLLIGFAASVPLETQSAPKAPAKTGAKVLRLKRHAFPDVTMGAREAYSALLPPGWKASGQVKWQQSGEALFPQQEFEITSPQGGRINYEPMTTFSYTESDLMGAQGVPAPANFPQWLAAVAPQADPKIKNVKLVSSRRDPKMEAWIQKMDAATGSAGGMQREIWNIVLDYNEGKVRRRDELNLTYVRFSPYISQGLSSQMWSIGHGGSFSAPVAQFAALRPALLRVGATVRPTPAWHIQSQAVIAEMSRQRTANNWERIKARGRQISRVSDEQYASYKKSMASGDAAQRARINTIRETDDFRDSDGSIVNLPMHYGHVFSDGKGNYVLSNNSQDRPGSAWKTIRPMK